MIDVNVLIIEDDSTVVSVLKKLVCKMGGYVIAAIDNSEEAMSLIYNTGPDVIFMNIDIKGRYSGLELVRKIKPLQIPIIYIPAFDTKDNDDKNDWHATITNSEVKSSDKITLYASIALTLYTFWNVNDYQYNGSEVNTNDYWKNSRLTDSIFIKKGDALCKVYFKDILYIKADGNYCEIQTTNGKFIHKITLTKLVNSLPKRHFLKIHRSYIVYIHHIRKFSLSRNELAVGNYTVPIGKGYKVELLDHLQRI